MQFLSQILIVAIALGSLIVQAEAKSAGSFHAERVSLLKLSWYGAGKGQPGSASMFFDTQQVLNSRRNWREGPFETEGELKHRLFNREWNSAAHQLETIVDAIMACGNSAEKSLRTESSKERWLSRCQDDSARSLQVAIRNAHRQDSHSIFISTRVLPVFEGFHADETMDNFVFKTPMLEPVGILSVQCSVTHGFCDIYSKCAVHD